MKNLIGYKNRVINLDNVTQLIIDQSSVTIQFVTGNHIFISRNLPEVDGKALPDPDCEQLIKHLTESVSLITDTITESTGQIFSEPTF